MFGTDKSSPGAMILIPTENANVKTHDLFNSFFRLVGLFTKAVCALTFHNSRKELTILTLMIAASATI